MDVHDRRIPDDEFATCLRHLPQVCVDLVVEYDGGVLVARRTNEPAEGEWFWPGGRVRKGERLHDAARRVAREELGLSVEIVGRLGVSEHFWDDSSVPGVTERHTVPVVYLVRPRDPTADVQLDDQHDAYRTIDGGGEDIHEYVEEYVRRFDLPQ